GMNPDDFQISFDERILRIRGVRVDKQRKLSYHCLEIQYGEFLSEVYLPGIYDDTAIEAKYENGFLTINLPKLEPEGPHHIAVHADQD
ncbi:MAG: Hsp20/alpha crystallin family protein, partial [Rudaea sp.]